MSTLHFDSFDVQSGTASNGTFDIGRSMVGDYNVTDIEVTQSEFPIFYDGSNRLYVLDNTSTPVNFDIPEILPTPGLNAGPIAAAAAWQLALRTLPGEGAINVIYNVGTDALVIGPSVGTITFRRSFDLANNIFQWADAPDPDHILLPGFSFSILAGRMIFNPPILICTIGEANSQGITTSKQLFTFHYTPNKPHIPRVYRFNIGIPVVQLTFTWNRLGVREPVPFRGANGWFVIMVNVIDLA